MKIIEILQQRSINPKDDVKIELKLYNLADNLEKKARAHLKRINTVLTEFDIHDEKHSEKVIENIEKLLGDEKLNSLSTYELFLLHLSAFFHDCAMAPSDWEINTMKLTEGNSIYHKVDYSIRHDLKPALKFTNAKQIVIENKKNLYKVFESDVKDWMFSPQTEQELIDYLSSLLVEYQNYRNGFADRLKKIKNQLDFEELNDFIRIDYIRATHHTRIETYIKNLEIIFSTAFEQPAWGKKLAHDLSLICRSHGEDSSFLNDFNINAQYYGAESANLQFVAVMLRLGDIIHFSYDRAPIDLRTSKLFKSEYSFQQWAIKYSGANYSIEKGKISFRAYCENPETYFKLHQYIDWIEYEIQNYFKFQRQWPIIYIENLQDKVERINIINDENSFLPKRGLNFSLNQKKILDLLMGVGLYKDKFACLRELYQNSLDACRCMISRSETEGSFISGKIEFRLENENEKRYLYCIDNGIGMTKDIIENYLLKIGNSYYKSSDFYKQQANWGSKFTPTSQFGIGILSCFMIGDKIEITTKTNTGDFVSCSIDGPHENFYYKKTSLKDKENIPISGTIVKVLLNENSATLNNKKINKLGLLLLGIHVHLPEKFKGYHMYLKNWEEHLFNKINYFVQIVPQNINVEIGIEDETKLQISSKPILIDDENTKLEINESDFDFIDYINNSGRYYPITHTYREIKNFVDVYPICIQLEKTEYFTTLILPKKGFTFDDVKALYSIPIAKGQGGICIDGIIIDRDNLTGFTNYYSDALTHNGIINFTGELRPQLSVDRTSVIDYPKECEKTAEEISKNLLKEILNITKKHIDDNKFDPESKESNLIWEYIFEKIGFADIIFINEFSHTKYGDIKWKKLNEKLTEKKSIRDFLMSSNISVKDFNLKNNDILTKKLLLTKLISAKEIDVDGTNINILQENLVTSNLIKKRNSYSEYELLILADSWKIFDENFDIVSNLYPLVPNKVFQLIDRDHVGKISDRIKTIHSFTNGLTAFFSQSPLLINQKLGLYRHEKGVYGEKINKIYSFEQKRSTIGLFELNDKFIGLEKKERYVLMIYISPILLNAEEIVELEKCLNIDGSYVKGVKEGWSLLATGMEKQNVIIYPGKTTREKLVSLIHDDFWETYNDFTFKFTDNTKMEKTN